MVCRSRWLSCPASSLHRGNTRRPRKGTHMTAVRKGQAPAQLTRDEFGQRFRQRFVDPAFEAERAALAPHRGDRVGGLQRRAQGAAHAARPAPASPIPTTSCRSSGVETRERLRRAQQTRQRAATTPSRVLRDLRLARATTAPARARCRRPSACAKVARRCSTASGIEVDFLDLSLPHLRIRRASIHPCKALRVDRDAALPLAVQLLSRTTRSARSTTG